jgi:hypothetical protein
MVSKVTRRRSMRGNQDSIEKDFMVTTEDLSRKKQGKRVYLNDTKTRSLMKELKDYFESYIDIPRIQLENSRLLKR